MMNTLLLIVFMKILPLIADMSRASTSFIYDVEPEITDMEALYGSSIILPCGVQLNTTSVSVILWFKFDQPLPLYKYDNRQLSSFKTASKSTRNKSKKYYQYISSSQENNKDFNSNQRIQYYKDKNYNRLTNNYINDSNKTTKLLDIPINDSDANNKINNFNHNHNIHKYSSLQMHNLTMNDMGLYRCRVDYINQPSSEAFINLTIIVPPKSAIIMDSEGQRLDGVIGPYKQNSNLTLICEAEGGIPEPTVTWWKSGEMISTGFSSPINGLIRNTLYLYSLNRSNLMNVFTCLVSNTELALPIEISVSLDLILPPLDALIISPNVPLKASELTSLSCLSRGSRPAPNLLWALNEQEMYGNTMEKDGAFTSVLTFTPKVEDNGKNITCKGINSLLSVEKNDTRRLNVLFSPVVTLSLGASLDPLFIREGSDVYFECTVAANPWITEVNWLFSGTPLHSDLSSGLIVSNQSLVLQSVKRSQKGPYQCEAINTQGTTISNIFFLKINYAPTCLTPSKVYGVDLDESIALICSMDAYPLPLSFKWTFNTSYESTILSTFSINGSSSTLTYIPKSPFEYGYILCTANNTQGISAPCVFNLLLAGPPSPISNCEIVSTTTTLNFNCFTSSNDSVYIFTLYKNFLIVANITKDKPKITFDNLQANNDYTLKVVVFNGRHSKEYTAQARTQQYSKGIHKIMVINPLIGLFICIIGIIIISISLITFFIKIRKKFSKRQTEMVTDSCKYPCMHECNGLEMETYHNKSIISNPLKTNQHIQFIQEEKVQNINYNFSNISHVTLNDALEPITCSISTTPSPYLQYF